MSTIIERIFGRSKALIGMVHVHALPGTPRAERSIDEIVAIAEEEARTLRDAGFDGVMIENMHDRPYVMNVGPEIVAAMTRVGAAVRDAAPELPLGVQILSLSGRQTIAVAAAVGAAFVRIENFAFAHIADEGLMPAAEAGDLLRFRRALGAESIAIFADVKKKHASHAITADLPLADVAAAAEFFLTDGLVVTGRATGDPVPIGDLRAVREATTLPILVGSGASPDQLPALSAISDGVIVGSALKRDGRWSEPLDAARCEAMASAFRGAIA